MSEEIKNIQTDNKVENDNINNQDSHNQNYEKIISEIEFIKEKILNIDFQQKTPFQEEKEEKQEIKKFKLG